MGAEVNKMTDERSMDRTMTVEMPDLAVHTVQDGLGYHAVASETSCQYRDHLAQALQGDCRVMSEDDYEDAMRYQAGLRAERAVMATATPVAAVANTEVVKVFNKKRLGWLVAYVAIALAVIMALLFTVPGTAWEKTRIEVNPGDVSYGVTSPVASADDMAMNKIYTADGGVVEVDLAPYVEDTNEEQTNWFDQLCDWLSGVVGG